MSETMLSWLATYALHSTLLIGAAWLATRKGPLAGSTARDAIWKIATTAALLTATAQVAGPIGSWTLEWGAAPSSASIAARPGVPRQPASAEDSGSPREVMRAKLTAHDRAGAGAGLAPALAGAPDGSSVEESLIFRGEGLAVSESGPEAAANDRHRAEPAEGSASISTRWRELALASWLALGATLLARTAFRRRRYERRLGQRREIAEGPARDALDGLLGEVGMGRPVRLTETSIAVSPMALRRNEICVPERALRELDRRALRALLAHELAHLLRRDPLWIAISSVFENLLFFQPLHRVGRRELRAAAEEECDAWAVRMTGERHALARCLVEVAGWMRGARAAAVAGMAEPGPGLERRVRRLIGARAETARGSGRVGALMAGALVIAVACGAPGVRSTERDTARAEPEERAAGGLLAEPPSVGAARPSEGPEAAAQLQDELGAAPDTLERSDRVREYVWTGDAEAPWFAFDFSPEKLGERWGLWSSEKLEEHMERFGPILERSLEPLEGFEFHFEPGEFLEEWNFSFEPESLEGPGWRFLLGPDSLRRHRLPLDSLMAGTIRVPRGAFALAVPGSDGGLRVRIEGDVDLSAGTIAGISPGGRVEIRDRRGEPARSLIVTPGPDGELSFDYEVDGRPHGFDEEARSWLRGVVERLERAEKGGKGLRMGRRIDPKGLADIRILRREEARERARDVRADALRARLQSLEREMNRLREEIDRLERTTPQE